MKPEKMKENTIKKTLSRNTTDFSLLGKDKNNPKKIRKHIHRNVLSPIERVLSIFGEKSRNENSASCEFATTELDVCTRSSDAATTTDG